MSVRVLVPFARRLHIVEARRKPAARSEIAISGLPQGQIVGTAERVLTAIHASDLPLPSDRTEVDIEPHVAGSHTGALDLPIALAMLLADPEHRWLALTNLVAHGRVGLDGVLGKARPPGIASLPPQPWVGRFWRPTDRIPEITENAFLSIVDVETLGQAWEALGFFVWAEGQLNTQLPYLPMPVRMRSPDSLN